MIAKKEHYSRNSKVFRTLFFVSALCISATVLFSLYQRIKIEPFLALDGAIWMKDGFHYISNEELSLLADQLNAPQEQELELKVQNGTPNCDVIETGYCKLANGDYAHKTLVVAAVPAKAGTPDRREVIGYCTLCADGTFSPSCAVGSGACSWHGGVSAYNVAQYRIIKGLSPEPAKPAEYNYDEKTYKDSPQYVEPSTPSIDKLLEYLEKVQ